MAINICVQIFEIYGKHVFQSVFCTLLHFAYKRCMRILVAAWSSHHLLVSLKSLSHSKTVIGILDAHGYLYCGFNLPFPES